MKLRLWTLREAAEKLEVSRGYMGKLTYRTRNGLGGPAYYMVDGRVMFDPRELIAWRIEHKRKLGRRRWGRTERTPKPPLWRGRPKPGAILLFGDQPLLEKPPT